MALTHDLLDPTNGFRPVTNLQKKLFELFPLQEHAPEPIDSRWLIAIAEIGSGKTEAGSVWAILQSLWHGDSLQGLILSQSLQTSTLANLFACCKRYGIPVDPWCGSAEATAVEISESHGRCFYLGDRRMLWHVSKVSEMDLDLKFQRVWIDETELLNEPIFDSIEKRLHGLNGDKCHGLITTSPNHAIAQIVPYGAFL